MIFSSQVYVDVKIVLIMYLFVLTSQKKKTLVAFFPQGRSTTFAHRNAPFPMKGNIEDIG